MPLVRVEIRNEYGLGAPELYREANKEDPKEVLDGVAVAGLVGILRQLGDLAEFAAEVFHGLQEELMITTSRSHKLMGRVRSIEAALSPVEKAVLAQRSHLHYAYTAGSNWHPRIRCHQNHFLYSDMAQFIMDSYEDCRGIPSLHLLDKFDPGGPGSCLRRYSDPTFFKRASAGSGEAHTEKNPKNKKGRRIQRKGSRARSRKVSQDASFLSHNGRTQVTQSSVDGQTSPFQMVSTFGATLKSDVGERPNLDSRTGSGYMKCIFNPTYSMQSEDLESKESFSSPLKNQSHPNDYEFLKEKGVHVDDDNQINLSEEQTRPISPCGTWDEKTDRLEEANAQEYDADENLESSSTNFDLDGGSISLGTASQMDVQLFKHNLPTSKPGGVQLFKHNLPTSKPGGVQLFKHNLLTSKPGGDIQVDYIEGCGAVDFVSDHQMDVQLCHHERQTSSPGNIQLDYTERDGTGNIGSGDRKDIHLCDPDVPAMKPVDIQIDDIEVGEAVNFRSVDQMDVHDASLARYGDIQIDDIGSETEHYMDALNTIESEAETDTDFTTEQEVLHYDKSDDKKIHEGSFGFGTQLSDCHSLNLKSDFLDLGALNNVGYGNNAFSASPDTPADSCYTEVTEEDKSDDKKIHEGSFGIGTQLSDCHSLNVKSNFLDIGTLNSDSYGNNAISASPDTPVDSCYTEEVTEEDKFNTISFENNSHLLSPQMASLETGHPENADGTNIESVYSKVSSCKCGEDDMSMSSPECQKPPPGPSNVTSVKFWTNGGLLGLEPSKPPDFNVLNLLSQDAISESNAKTSMFSQSSNFGGDGDKGKLDKNSTAVKWGSNMGSSKSCRDDQENDLSLRDRSCKYSTVDLNIKATTAWQENIQNASQMFETGSTFILNGPNRKLSHAGDNISNHGSRQSSGVFEHNNHHKVAYQTFPGKNGGLFEVKSAATSPSSPPLEHMKISFQPIDGFETSKLKLKFRDGISSCESNKDAFPSFQLVPEPSVVSYSVGLDSDDDTFYRSTPSMSDDCLSRHSEMISEQWESGESPSSKDRDLYDALCRISLSESVSTTLENGTEIPENSTLPNPFTEYGIENSQPRSSLDLPSFDSINHHSIKEEQRNCFHEMGFLELRFQSTPPPPPLPPLQWRAMNPYSYDVENGPVTAHQATNHANDQKFSVSTISRQPKPSPIDQDKIIEAVNVQKSKHLELQKLNGGKDNQAVNGESMEEKKDFLHQIRTKSFSLRPTVTSKPTLPTGGPANGEVAAILEKANAIRQVVGSDDWEEDENWSDP